MYDISNEEGKEIKLFGASIGVQSDVVVDTTLRMNDNSENVQQLKRENTWTDNEHINFLEGLEKLGRGNWKEISTKYVPTRTPSQIASHAQKHFNRLADNKMKRRRTSVFDITHPRPNLDSDEGDELQASGVAGVPKNPSSPANGARTTCEKPPLPQVNEPKSPPSQVNKPEIHQQPRASSSKRARRFMPAVCWISTDDYSNESTHIHGFVIEPIQDQPNGSGNPTTNNAGKILREMVLCDTCRETVLREAKCEHMDTKTVLPKSAVLRDSTNCDVNPKTLSLEPVALRDSMNFDVNLNMMACEMDRETNCDTSLEAEVTGDKPKDGVV